MKQYLSIQVSKNHQNDMKQQETRHVLHCAQIMQLHEQFRYLKVAYQEIISFFCSFLIHHSFDIQQRVHFNSLSLSTFKACHKHYYIWIVF